MKNRNLESRIDGADFQFHNVPPETLELNQETIDSVRRWYDYQMKLGGSTQNAHILDLLCEDILDAWEGDYPALSALQKDLDTAKRTHLAGLGRYLKGLIRIGEMLLEREPSLNESADGVEQTDLNGIYQSLKSEYNGKTWGDEFMRTHVTLKDDQVICWFDLDSDDEGFEEKRDCAISFYDEVVRFLVDNFGEEFKYEDPRISSDYIDRNNMYGQYDIVLDDDGENAPVIAIWENEENKMKTRFNESLYGVPGAEDVDWAIIYKNCHIEPSEFYGNLGELYDEEHPEDPNHKGFDDWCWENTDLIMSELDHLASYDDDYEGDDYYAEGGIRKELVPQNGRKSFGHKAAEEEDDDGFTLFSYNTPVARLERSDDGSHLDFILLNDYLSGTTLNHIHSFLISHKQDDIPSKKLKMMQVGDKVPLMAAESRKLVKEGAGAGYDVKINGLKLGEILDRKLVKGKQAYDDYYVCQVEILPCECEIGAEDYYNDFFWQEHEFGETPTAKIDGGVATIEYSTNSMEEDAAEEELRREVSNRELDISFSYSWGWTHSDLPRENMKFTDVDVNEKAFYGSITKLELNAPDLADAVNSGYASIFDRDEEEEEPEDEEPVDESMGGKREVFTIEVNYIDEEDEPQMIEAMKYAKTYYSINGALNAAKEAYQEYSRKYDEPIEVWILGGEYEMPEGDIYGEPDVIEVVNSETIGKL